MAMVQVICEIASAHAGKLETLKVLARSASEAEADWFKVQIFDFESLVSEDNKRFSVLRDIELSESCWNSFLEFSVSLSTPLIAEFFDELSVRRFGANEAVRAVKIPISDLEDPGYISAIVDLKKPVFLSVSGALPSELHFVLSQLKSGGIEQITLMLGFQSFPTRLDESFLSKIAELKRCFGLEVGYADHCDANDIDIAYNLPVMAMGAGASVIEKHITLNRSEKGFDYYSALNPDEFKQFVSHLKTLCPAMGNNNLEVMSLAEQKYRGEMRKFAVANKAMYRGQILSGSDIVYRRIVGEGMTRSDIKELGNTTVTKEISAGDTIKRSLFDVQKS